MSPHPHTVPAARRGQRLAAASLLLLAAGCATSAGPRTRSVEGAAPAGPLAFESSVPHAAVPIVPAAQDDERPGGIDGVLHDITHGDVYAKFRARFENVNMQGFKDEAHVLTLRSVIGYRTKEIGDTGISALLEIEDVSAYNDDYNSTVNGNVTRPVVADPEGTEVNQAYLAKTFGDHTTVKAGRQEIVHANARFVGNVAWRQNFQSYDAVSVNSTAIDGVKLEYAWLNNANRIFGDDHPAGDTRMNSHILRASGEVSEDNALSGYWYYVDYDQQSNFTALSTQTAGVRYDGKVAVGDESNVKYMLEFAKQKDAGKNPNSVDANYYRVETTGNMGPWSVGVGQEVLQGSKSPANLDRFTTPLATLHAFNGWADLFLATPATGLVDTFFTVAHKLGKTHRVAVIYHDFSADASARDYGWETNAILTGKATENSYYGIKFAEYHAQDFGVDVRKTWIWWGFGT